MRFQIRLRIRLSDEVAAYSNDRQPHHALYS
jgi:hypothetical protein